MKITKRYELIDMCNTVEYQRKMIILAKRCIKSQTNTWHLNSSKKVACCIYLPNRDDYIIAQNIGISYVTGSLCAERAAVAIAVSKYPDLQFEEITNIFVLGEKNPLLPCGVCCEWLYKINPQMQLYTLKDDKLLKINIANYYGDEHTIESKFDTIV